MNISNMVSLENQKKSFFKNNQHKKMKKKIHI